MTFNGESIKRIEWDLTTVPAANGEGNISGEYAKGTLQEPSEEQIDRFDRVYSQINLQAAKAQKEALEAIDNTLEGKPVAEPSEKVYVGQIELVREALGVIGVPQELIKVLPPRYAVRFLRYIQSELVGEDDAGSSNG